ncbi:hypothetical protein PISMIDRAFT_15886 [Pisolithus microcarpus 441]|uniref:Uncharacterized protein n=1 Tax=Pisolithus microcarpus 441 TaxID=765257 RepID=A0A0C9XV75_9AGAM|nr:hypothetical protein PISMIDRAFT_15886 [Pisolithus microcarpus 441]
MNIANNLEANVIDGVAANNVNDIHIEYHPNATIPPQEIPFAKFAQGHRPRAYKPDMSTDPWYPFQSYLDFEFAELALKVALNKEQVNRLLHWMKSICSMGEVFTLNEYNNLQSTWQAASHRMMAFTKEVVCINSMDGKPQEFTMYYRSLWDWACGLLKHPSIGLHFIFDAQCLSKFDGSSFIHFIDKPWMANEFWNIQVLLFILYVNKVKLLSFGQQKGYPIVACLANLPVLIQNGEGIGGGRVIGKGDKGALWQNVMIEKESQAGCWVNCWDGIPHRFFPIVLILSADYEEQVVMTLIRGIKSNFPCPICLIPCDHISDFPTQCELWTSKNVLKVLEDTCSQDTQEKKEQILIQQGLHHIDSAFTVVMNTDVYHALSWDQLHANFSGKFGDHLWAELLRVLDKAGCQTMAMVEKNFSMMPCWHMLNHFDKALSISYTDGQKFKDLSKPNEKMHGPLKEKYQKCTNFKNIAQQILDVDHLEAVLELIRCRISDYDVYLSNMEANMRSSEGNNVDNVEQEDFFHVRLGSRVKQPSALGAIEQRSTTDKAFT